MVCLVTPSTARRSCRLRNVPESLRSNSPSVPDPVTPPTTPISSIHDLMVENPPIAEVEPIQPIETVPPVTLEVSTPTEIPVPTPRHSYENYTKKVLYDRWIHAKNQLFCLREDVVRLSKELKTAQKEVSTYERK